MRPCCDTDTLLLNRTIGVITELKCEDHSVPPGLPPCPNSGFRWGTTVGLSQNQSVRLHDNGELHHILYGTASRTFAPDLYCLDKHEVYGAYAVVCIKEVDEEHGPVLHTVYPVGLSISILCFTISILLQALFVRKWNLQKRLLMNNLCCWALGYLTLLLRFFLDHVLHCLITGVLIHYTFLSAFCWLNVLAMHMSIKLSGRNIGKAKQASCYNVMGWGIPAIFTVTAVAAYLQDSSSTVPMSPDTVTCYMSLWIEMICFYGPLAFSLCANMLLFMTISLRIRILHKQQQKLKEKSSTRLYLCIRLFVILGVGWIIEGISWLREAPLYLKYAALAVSLLQGPLVLLVIVYDIIKWRKTNCPSRCKCCPWFKLWSPKHHPDSCTTTSLAAV